jgi:hypothetical protein
MKNKTMQDTVTDIQKDFIYEKFSTGPYTIYHCHKPNTSNYSFEIILGKIGIAIIGDFTNITFKIARDLTFLAGDDVDYYIHSKLDHIYYDLKEIDQSLLDNYLKETLLIALDDFEHDEDGNITFPTKSSSLQELVDYYDKHNLNQDTYDSRQNPKPYYTAWELYSKLSSASDLTLQQIWEIIHDYGECPCITKPSENVMFTLYMTNHAAKKILSTERP